MRCKLPTSVLDSVIVRWRVVVALAVLLAPAAFPAGFVRGTELGNPMEKHFFSDTGEEPISNGRSGQFSDRTLPTAAKKTPSKKTSPEKIRQVSGQQVSGAAHADVWNKAAASIQNETTLADWGVTAAADTAATAPVRSGYSPPTSYPQTNTYSNTGPASSASPTAALAAPNPWQSAYGQTAQNMPGMGGAAGFGYFQPPAVPMTNPYASPWAADPYGAYGSMYGAPPFPQDPYGMQNPAQQQLPLYQAMLQQEMIRREVEQEIEDEERAAREEAERAAADASWSLKQLMPVHVTSPLGETLVSCAKTVSPFCTPIGPDRGVGQPLRGASWMDRPWYFGGFCGWIDGSDLVSNMIDQKDGAMGGLILGYNISEYWGVESRLHFTSIDIKETRHGRQAFDDWYRMQYPDDTFVPSLPTRTNHLSVFDVSVHYYPLGNAKWRPYFKYGLGFARESFVDTYGVKHREDTMTMPIGIGLRYWWNKRLAIQADLIDNVVFSSGIAKTQNNFAFCVGLTYSYGSSKKSRPTTYWPYTSSHGSRR